MTMGGVAMHSSKMKSLYFSTVCVALALGATSTAQATSVTIAESGSVVAGGGLTELPSISLAPYLNVNGRQAYVFSSMQLTLNGTTPFGGTNEQITITETNNPYTPIGVVGGKTYYTQYNSQIETDTVQDKLYVSDGPDSGTGSVGENSNAGPYFLVNSFSTSNAFYESNLNIVEQGYFGSFDAMLTASMAALGNMNQSETLQLYTAALNGMIDLNSVTLTYSLAPVPLPPSVLLFVSAIAVGAGWSRLRRRA